ncbi:MAG: hypothetical protein HKM02_12500 [Pseudomonadales bacterium]|nr:hypothetical protein [Pseudomonadales bacterium]
MSRTLHLLALCLATQLTACGGDSAYYNSPIGTFQAGPNSTQGALLPPVNLILAGVYSVSYSVKVYGTNASTTENDYLYIGPTGLISTFVSQDAGNILPTRNCYLHATGSEPNAKLQGAQLYETADQSNNIYYHTTVNGYDIGIAPPTSTANSVGIYINGVLQPNSTNGSQTYKDSHGDTFILGGQNNTTFDLAELNICT